MALYAEPKEAFWIGNSHGISQTMRPVEHLLHAFPPLSRAIGLMKLNLDVCQHRKKPLLPERLEDLVL